MVQSGRPAVRHYAEERFGIRRLLLTGSAAINGSFLAAGLVNDRHVLVAPAVAGGTEAKLRLHLGQAAQA